MRTIDWSASKKKYVADKYTANVEDKYTENNDKEKNVTYHLPNNISKKNIIPKYPILMVLFVAGIVSVSIIKNETRSLQKEINNLQASIKVLKSNLEEEKLEYEAITSPENISFLAKEYLDEDLKPYKKTQIKSLNEKLILEKNNQKITKKLEKNNNIKNKIIVAKKK